MRWPSSRRRHLRRAVLALAAIMLSLAGGAAPVRYGVDEHSGSIEFQTRGFGLLRVHGQFGRFTGRLDLDPEDLAQTRIDVDVDARDIESPWPGVAPRLRSMAYFDADMFPLVRFRSTAVAPGPERHVLLSGILTIRGIERPQQFDVTAVLAGSGDGAVAAIVATGTLSRSEFGMLADQGLVSDTVRLTITARIRLPRATGVPAPPG